MKKNILLLFFSLNFFNCTSSKNELANLVDIMVDHNETINYSIEYIHNGDILFEAAGYTDTQREYLSINGSFNNLVKIAFRNLSVEGTFTANKIEFLEVQRCNLCINIIDTIKTIYIANSEICSTAKITPREILFSYMNLNKINDALTNINLLEEVELKIWDCNLTKIENKPERIFEEITFLTIYNSEIDSIIISKTFPNASIQIMSPPLVQEKNE